jgi:FtsZ-interacting cell division protein ZipA
MTTLVLVLVGALVLAALVVAGGGLDRSRRVRRTRVVERPVQRVVERPVEREVVRERPLD